MATINQEQTDNKIKFMEECSTEQLKSATSNRPGDIWFKNYSHGFPLPKYEVGFNVDVSISSDDNLEYCEELFSKFYEYTIRNCGDMFSNGENVFRLTITKVLDQE